MKLIRGIDNKVRGAELLVYNKNSEKIEIANVAAFLWLIEVFIENVFY